MIRQWRPTSTTTIATSASEENRGHAIFKTRFTCLLDQIFRQRSDEQRDHDSHAALLTVGELSLERLGLVLCAPQLEQQNREHYECSGGSCLYIARHKDKMEHCQRLHAQVRGLQCARL